MTLNQLVQPAIHIDSKSSLRVTACGYCNLPLPTPFTTRVFVIEGSRMGLHFHSFMCAFKYEYARRNTPRE